MARPLHAPASLGEEKKRIWFLDQYRNPHEDTFTVDDVLGWFADDGSSTSTRPRIVPLRGLGTEGKLFEPTIGGAPTSITLLAQLG